jgi:hypothetical protein
LSNQTIDIPVLSWLYQGLTGENLTVVNAMTLVAAIPITVTWRVFEGQWPSQSLAGEVHHTLLNDAQLGLTPVVVTIMTVLGGVFDLFGGAFSAAVDAVSDREPDTPGAPTGVDEILPNYALGCALFGAIIAFPTAQKHRRLRWQPSLVGCSIRSSCLERPAPRSLCCSTC